MSYEKVGKLIDSLYTSSKHGNITWEESEVDGTYQVSFPKYSVRIFYKTSSPNYGGEGTEDYFIQIINEDGLVIDEVSDVDVKDIIEDSYKKLKETYDLARRQSLGVEEALDAIISNLDDLNDCPF